MSGPLQNPCPGRLKTPVRATDLATQNAPPVEFTGGASASYRWLRNLAGQLTRRGR